MYGCTPTYIGEGETQAFIPLSQTLDTETKEEDNQKSVQWYRSTTKPKPTNNEGNLRKPGMCAHYYCIYMHTV